MVDTVVLDGHGGSLRIEAGPKGWCRCELISSRRTYLGAANIDHLTSRLLAALDEDLEGDAIGEILGYEVSWVMSLSEAHCTLYATTGGPDLTLFWQDAEAKLIGAIRLSRDQRFRWRQQLESLVTSENTE